MPQALSASAAIVLIVASYGCSRTPPDKLITDYDAGRMEAAIARARSEMERFVEEMQSRRGEDFSVKVRIADGDKGEYFWLSELTIRDGAFEGSISNDPGIVGNVRRGQKWIVKKGEAADWMFRRDGKIHGNYTLRPLLEKMPAAEAARYREMLAEP